MKKGTLIESLILVFLVASNTTFLLEIPAGAQSSTTMSVVNPTSGNSSFIFNTNASPIGYRFNVTAWVYNVTDLFAYQVYLTYNSSLLSATSAWIPKWDPQWAFYGKQTVLPTPQVNTVDWVKIGDSLLYPESTFNGTGLLAIVEFEIVRPPPTQGKISSNLAINNTDTYLLDSATVEITAEKTNGYYEYNWSSSSWPQLAVSPTEVEFGPSPPWAVGQETDIEVYIRSSFATWYVTNATFSLNFNPLLLAVVHIDVDSLWNQSTIDNATTPGQIFASVGRTMSAAHGDVSVMSVRFRIIYQGTYPRNDTSDIWFQATEPYWLLNNFTVLPVGSPVNGKIVINGLSAPFPTLSVFPSLVDLGPQQVVGKQFDIQIWLKGLDASWNLSTVTIKLDFNSTLVEPLGVQAGPFLSQFGNTMMNSSIETNRVNIKLALQSNPSTNPSGEGLVATVKFNATYQPTVPEFVETPFMIDASSMQGSDGNNIPVEFSDGIYRISGLASAEVNVLSPLTAEVGSDVIITGFLEPARANINVTLYCKLSTTQTWTLLGSVETDNNGNFTYVWKTSGADIGEYQIKAEQLGDATTYPSSSSVKTISLVPKSPFNTTLLTLIALLIVVPVGLAVVVYLRRKRMPKSPQEFGQIRHT